MKKICLLFLLAILSPRGIFAYDFEVDGIYYYNHLDGTASVAPGYTISNSYYGDVVIPSVVTYRGISYSVTDISGYAFFDCPALTSVTIPESVTSIGGEAFVGCSALTSIIIPKGITSIEANTFKDCSALTSFNIPESVMNIDYAAFSGCSALTSITIPKGVTSIGHHAFFNCSSLESIVVAEGNTQYDSRNNCNAIIETASNTLITGCKETIIPEGVTSIGDEAFCNCYALTSITIPESVTSIGDYAFYYCSALTSVTILEGVTDIGNSAFAYCFALTSVAIPESVTNIGDEAFFNCSALTSVIIPKSVTNIGNRAFNGCFALTSVTIPESVTNIGNYTFSSCYALASVTIPESITNIGDGAFRDCSALTSVIIPKSVNNIGYRAFSGCSNLESIVVVEGNTQYDSRNNCNALIETASNTLITGCNKTIIPADIASIGVEAFSKCLGLTSITIPKGVTSIGDEAFYGCLNLTSITISESVTSIGDYAFSECDNIKDIYSNNPNPPVCGDMVFATYDYDFWEYIEGLLYESATLHIPIGSKEAYSSAECWGEFATIVEQDGREEIEITDMEYASYVTKFPVDFSKTEGLTAYIVTEATADGVVLEEVVSARMGNAVILHGKQGKYVLEENYTQADNIENNLLTAGGSQAGDGSTIYALGNKSKGVGFYLVKTGEHIPFNKGYLIIDPSQQPNGVKEFIPFGGEATGIETIAEEATEKEAVIYNLAGQRIAQPTKSGIYIVNGKKVFINK